MSTISPYSPTSSTLLPARCLLSVLATVTAVGGYLADWNETHVYNFRWPAHAKFHNGQTMSTGLGLGLLTAYFTWRRTNTGTVAGALDNLFIATLFSSLYWATQLSAIRFLGAYASLYYFLTRQKRHPIAGAFNSIILPALSEVDVKHVLALSTPRGFQYLEEIAKIDVECVAESVATQDVRSASERGDGRDCEGCGFAGAKDDQLEWTVFRMPILIDGDASAVVSAGEIFNYFVEMAPG